MRSSLATDRHTRGEDLSLDAMRRPSARADATGYSSLVRPAMILISSPIVLIISLYTSLVFGIMYLLFTTFTDLFKGQYGFSTSMSGLAYLGLLVALVGAMATFNAIGDRVGRSSPEASVGARRPEARLILMIWFSPLVGVGLFIYGWSAHYGVHWVVPIIGTVFIGFGTFFVLVSPPTPHAWLPFVTGSIC